MFVEMSFRVRCSVWLMCGVVGVVLRFLCVVACLLLWRVYDLCVSVCRCGLVGWCMCDVLMFVVCRGLFVVCVVAPL